MRPVGQALVCIVNIILIRLALGLPVPTAGIFIGAMVAAGLDLDRTEREPHNTPYGHSLLFVTIWDLLGIGLASALRHYVDPLDLGLGITVGLWSHLLLDILTGVPIYTIPRSARLSQAMRMEPAGPDFERLHDRGVAVAATWDIFLKVTNGEQAWPHWGRLPPVDRHHPQLVAP